MKIAERFHPWLFLWLPWLAVLLLAAVGVQFLPPPSLEPPPRWVTRDLPGDLAFLAKAVPNARVLAQGHGEAFLGPAREKDVVEEVPESFDEAIRQGVTVRLSGVVIGSRVRSGVINGVPYAEGDEVPEAGRVEKVQNRGVTIVGENGQKVFIGVGKRVDI
uniref:Uncharacterized protein n=1 Tax=Desulfacinum infernum TaxID=35837 RepID=A0A832EAJ1_9BACT